MNIATYNKGYYAGSPIKLIRKDKLIKLYERDPSCLITKLTEKGEMEFDAQEIHNLVNVGDILRLPGDGNSNDFDGCYSYKILAPL